MAGSGEKVFDAEKFRKQLKHFDNPNAGESGNAIRAALKLCQDAGKHFYEAVELAYGGSDGGNSERVKELEEQGEALAKKVLEFQEANGELQAEIDRLNAELDRLHVEQADAAEDETPAPSAFKWPSLSWSWPNRLTVALGVLIAANWFLINLIAKGHATNFLDALAWLRMVLFVVWGVCVVRIEGWRIFVVKAVLWLVGWFVVVIAAANLAPHYSYPPPFLGLSMFFKVMLIVPWFWWMGLSLYQHQLLSVLIALAVLAGVVTLNLSNFSAALVSGIRQVASKGKSL